MEIKYHPIEIEIDEEQELFPGIDANLISRNRLELVGAGEALMIESNSPLRFYGGEAQ